MNLKRDIDMYLSSFTRRTLRAFDYKYIRYLFSMVASWCRSYYVKKYKDADDRYVVINNYCGRSKMCLDRASYIGSSIYWRGWHHKNEVQTLLQLLSVDDVFIDIGANQGEFTIAMASHLMNGKVVAFEPQRDMFKLLEKNVSLNGFENVHLVNVGLGDQKKVLPLYTEHYDTDSFNHPENEGLYSLYKSSARSQFVEDISIDRLDDILPSIGLSKVSCIKIDIEGGELPALLGARQILEKYQPYILIELSENNFKCAGYSIANLFDFLLEVGYGKLSDFSSNVISLHDAVRENYSVQGTTNVLISAVQ